MVAQFPEEDEEEVANARRCGIGFESVVMVEILQGIIASTLSRDRKPKAEDDASCRISIIGQEHKTIIVPSRGNKTRRAARKRRHLYAILSQHCKRSDKASKPISQNQKLSCTSYGKMETYVRMYDCAAFEMPKRLPKGKMGVGYSHRRIRRAHPRSMFGSGRV